MGFCKQEARCEVGERPFRRLSAPEVIHAQLLAVARDVDGGDEETLQKWLHILLSSEITFHKARTQLRELPGVESGICFRYVFLSK